ncbi:Permease YjgP/YjgQ [hydrothermal vent metagenome]|uniref:Permease YjgP/YjgQ n=1 Tax=hydrothermal vent metagenome TaxID=652676 RepID=A0A1W1BIN9_9ZZZZ
MSLFRPSLTFRYLAKHYIINFIALLLGLSLAFSIIDYFQHSEQLALSSNYKILYVYYMWQESLVLLYPLTLIFAVIMTKLTLVKSSNMVILHSFGYTKRQLFYPFLLVSISIYLIFTYLHTTQFSYAKDKAQLMLAKDGVDSYSLKDLFFLYEGTFVYAKNIDPISKKMKDLVLFRLKGNNLEYTMDAKEAYFTGEGWLAENIFIRKLIYDKGNLLRYETETRDKMLTLIGYEPKIIESIQEGKALNMSDSFRALELLEKQKLNTHKLRSTIYYKIIFPLFSIAMVLILFFKIPFHARYMNLALVLAISLGISFLVWGILFAFNQMGQNGVIPPELAIPLPISILWIYALSIFFNNKERV